MIHFHCLVRVIALIELTFTNLKYEFQRGLVFVTCLRGKGKRMKGVYLRVLGVLFATLLIIPLASPIARALIPPIISASVGDVSGDTFMDIVFTATDSGGNGVPNVEINITSSRAPPGSASLLSEETNASGICIFYNLPNDTYVWNASEGTPSSGQVMIPIHTYNFTQEEAFLVNYLAINLMGDSTEKTRTFYQNLSKLVGFDLSLNPLPSKPSLHTGESFYSYSAALFRWFNALDLHILSLGITDYDVLGAVLNGLEVSKSVSDAFLGYTYGDEMPKIQFAQDINQKLNYKVDSVTIGTVGGVATGCFGIFLASFDLYNGLFAAGSQWKMDWLTNDLVLRASVFVHVEEDIAGIFDGALTVYASLARAAGTLVGEAKVAVSALQGVAGVVIGIATVVIAIGELHRRYPTWQGFVTGLDTLDPILLLELATIVLGFALAYLGISAIAAALTGAAVASSATVVGLAVGIILATIALLISYFDYNNFLRDLRAQLGNTLTRLFGLRTSLYSLNTTQIRESADLYSRYAVSISKFAASFPNDLFTAGVTKLNQLSQAQSDLSNAVDDARPKLDNLLVKYLHWDGTYNDWLGSHTVHVRAHLEGYNSTKANYNDSTQSFLNDAVIGTIVGGEWEYSYKYVDYTNLNGTDSLKPYSELARQEGWPFSSWRGWCFEPPTENDTVGNPSFAVTCNIDSSGEASFKYEPKLSYLSYSNVHNVTVGGQLEQFYEYKFFFDGGTTNDWTGRPQKETLDSWIHDINQTYSNDVEASLKNVQQAYRKLQQAQDAFPPTTTLTIGEPKSVDGSGNTYVSSSTPFILNAADEAGGSGVACTSYRISNNTYSSGWRQLLGMPPYMVTFSIPFVLDDGIYTIEYNSTDNAGNVEPTHSTSVILVNPSTQVVNILVPDSFHPALAGDPKNSTSIYVAAQVTSIPPIPAFNVEIGGKQSAFQLVNVPLWTAGVYVLNVTTPTQAKDGFYDLNLTVTYKGHSYSDVKVSAVQYSSAPTKEPIEKGLLWLRGRQSGDGSWDGSLGITSLDTLALLNEGYFESDATVKLAINFILGHTHTDGSIWTDSSHQLYETSLAIMTLVATHNGTYQNVIQAAKNWLVSTQWVGVAKEDWQYGGFGYEENQRPDLSNTQFALLALDAAGLPKDDPVWTKVQVFLARCQNINFSVTVNVSGTPYTVTPYNAYGGYDGGSIYQPGNSLAGGEKSYGSMTGAGIWGLLLSGANMSDSRFVAAFNWVSNNYGWNGNPGFGDPTYGQFYYYLSMAKALTMTGLKNVSGHDWYADLYNKLSGLQSSAGYWQNPNSWAYENVPELATAYAILALETRNTPPPIQSLSYLTFILNSHCFLRITDPEGNSVGYNYTTGRGENDILSKPLYSGPNVEPQFVIFFNPEPGVYSLELIGNSQGPYNLTIQGTYGDTVTKTFNFTDDIWPGELLGTNVTVTAIVGPIDIYTSQPAHESVHDVAVTNVVTNRTWVYQGWSVSINVTAKNNGDFDETVAVTLYYNITGGGVAGTQTLSLLMGENKTITFTWNTTGVETRYGGYTITAVADISPLVDSNSTNNVLQSPTKVAVRILGDMNGDGKVDIYDAITFANYFGSQKGDARWNADADINRDGITDIYDAIVIARHFGISSP
jgi:squalene-hopene/tetraprenyl-beta-curcumene cyclase